MKEASVYVSSEMRVGLLTGGFDRPYAFGLAMALAAKDVRLDVIGGAEVDSPEMHTTPGVDFIDFYGDPRSCRGPIAKARRVLTFYLKLFGYTLTDSPTILHVLWNNKFHLFDRTFVMAYYKLLGKKVVVTAHNVNAGQRDGNDSWLNRTTLWIQYRMADHIFVHTEKMKGELIDQFAIAATAVTVIPFGINNSVPNTELTSDEARRRLGIKDGEKAILFFGAIRPYKGLEYLADAFRQLVANDPRYRLIIAGERKKGSERYLDDILSTVAREREAGQVIENIAFVPDEETELYFKAADVSVLPYTLVFQSGVLFLSYSFGLPAIASDVGSFREDIIEGRTGLVCETGSASSLARTITLYFASDLYKTLESRRKEIRDFANARNSWDTVGHMTRSVYQKILEG